MKTSSADGFCTVRSCSVPSRSARVLVLFIVCVVVCRLPRAIAADQDPNDIPGTSPSAIVPDALLDLCASREFVFRQAGQTHRTYYYRLFRPTSRPDFRKLPIIVWLHGHGEYERTVQNVGQLAYVDKLILRDLDRPETYPFYLLAAQCPKDVNWISSAGIADNEATTDPASVVIAIVDELLEELPIDPDRVYLVGISSGGAAAWEMVQRRPKLFASAAPLACAPPPIIDLGRISAVPIWTFCSSVDLAATTGTAGATGGRFPRLGGNCVFTEVDTGTHDCWTTAFLDYKLLEWLLSQTRGGKDCPPPGSIGIATHCRLLYQSGFGLRKWWPQLTALAGLNAIAWVVWRHLKILQAKRLAIPHRPGRNANESRARSARASWFGIGE